MSENTSFVLKPFNGVYENEVRSNKEDKTSLHYHPGPCLLPPYFAEISKKILNLKIHPDDVWLVSYPRTGSTWLQEIVWLIGNDLAFDKAATTLQQIRAPLLEASLVLFEYQQENVVHNQNDVKLPIPKFYRIQLPVENCGTKVKNKENDMASIIGRLYSDPVGYVTDLPSPRFIKSHLAFELLPSEISTVKPKVIYIMRNPKDLCISYYFHCRLIHDLDVDFEYFCELFMNDLLPIGSIWNHYFGFWNRRHEKNFLVLRYEDLRKDTKSGIEQIANFLGKEMDAGKIASLENFLSVEKMRTNKACNLEILVEARQGAGIYEKKGIHFIRKGIIGDHKNYMTPDIEAEFDKWIEQNVAGTDLVF